MKTTKKTIQKMVREELSRPVPAYMMSDTELLREQGVQKAMTNFLKPLGKWGDEFTKKAGKKVDKFWNKVIGILEKEYQDALKGEKLDMQNKAHQAVYLKAISDEVVQSLEEASSFLEEASKVKDWTPKSGSEEDFQAWRESSDGQAADGFFSAVGVLIGMSESLGENIPEMKSLSQKGDTLDDPIELVKWIEEVFAVIKEMGTMADAADASEEFDKVISTMSSAENHLSTMKSNMNDSAKQLTQEWIALTRIISKQLHETIFMENKSMKVSKSRLRAIIREEILREEIGMKDEMAKIIQRLGVKDDIQMSKITSALKDPETRDATENKAFADLFFAILDNPNELQALIPLIKKASAETEEK